MRPIQTLDVARTSGLGRVWSTARFLCGGYRIRLDERGWHWMTGDVPAGAQRADVFVSTAIRSSLTRQKGAPAIDDELAARIAPEDRPPGSR